MLVYTYQCQDLLLPYVAISIIFLFRNTDLPAVLEMLD